MLCNGNFNGKYFLWDSNDTKTAGNMRALYIQRREQ